jgi:hypothetical protein
MHSRSTKRASGARHTLLDQASAPALASPYPPHGQDSARGCAAAEKDFMPDLKAEKCPDPDLLVPSLSLMVTQHRFDDTAIHSTSDKGIRT